MLYFSPMISVVLIYYIDKDFMSSSFDLFILILVFYFYKINFFFTIQIFTYFNYKINVSFNFHCKTASKGACINVVLVRGFSEVLDARPLPSSLVPLLSSSLSENFARRLGSEKRPRKR